LLSEQIKSPELGLAAWSAANPNSGLLQRFALKLNKRNATFSQFFASWILKRSLLRSRAHEFGE
jgi:hypothetical protein